MPDELKFEEYITLRKNLLDDFLTNLAQGSDFPGRLGESMRYSLLAGGKRFRPLLVFASYEACGGTDLDLILPIAAAVECLHTYSLIHDDLPAMDDDDLRRGQPTNHKQFDEATAILAGDGLLTYAFQLISQSSLPAEIRVWLIEELAVGAGPAGMVHGQMLDMQGEGQSLPLEQIRAMHAAKTGALIRASIRLGAICAQAEDQTLQALTEYGEHLGVLFQISDDILNVTSTAEELGKGVGTDAENHKATYVSIVGLEQAKLLAKEEFSAIQTDLGLLGDSVNRLLQCAQHIVSRVE
jgi:geranylgeranyl diphosphate synthase type II